MSALDLWLALDACKRLLVKAIQRLPAGLSKTALLQTAYNMDVLQTFPKAKGTSCPGKA